jgi:recombination protein RecA
MFGNPETTSGGTALKFYSTVRMDIRRIGPIMSGDEAIGSRTRVKVVKNKLAPPFRKAEFDIIYGKGISFEGDLIDLGVDFGIVDKKGSWFSFGETRLGQGREKACEFLKEDLKVRTEIEKEVRKKTGLTPAGDRTPSAGEQDTKDAKSSKKTKDAKEKAPVSS